jgi:hypothetical protein
MACCQTLLDTRCPSRYIMGLQWESWIFQNCAHNTTWSFTRLMIRNRGFPDAQFTYSVLLYSLSSPRTNRGPAAVQARLPSSDSSEDEHQGCRPRAARSIYPLRSRELIDSLPAGSIDLDRAALSERLASFSCSCIWPPSCV